MLSDDGIDVKKKQKQVLKEGKEIGEVLLLIFKN